MDTTEYNNGDPLMSISIDSIFESKGIPNILKNISNEISNDISLSKDTFSKVYDFNYDEFTASISIELINSNRKDIYGTSRFGIYSMGKLKGCEINIYLDLESYDIIDLNRVITHELLHIYEIFNRCKRNIKTDLQWRLNNFLIEIRSKYSNNKLISDLIYLIYISLDQEINARVAETYTVLMDTRTKDYNLLISKLKLTSAWRYCNDLEEFNINNYDNIDWSIINSFFIELNTKMSNKFKDLKFNLYKIPTNQKESKEIIRNWSYLFKSKSKRFRKKLIGIIDEVVTDVMMIESSTIYFDDSKRLSDKYILKYEEYLIRESKISKILRY